MLLSTRWRISPRGCDAGVEFDDQVLVAAYCLAACVEGFADAETGSEECTVGGAKDWRSVSDGRRKGFADNRSIDRILFVLLGLDLG